MTPEPIAPHKPLRSYYAEDAARPAYVRGLFDDAAPHYEWIEKVMSFGSGESYRRIALSGAGLRPGMKVLDIAAGTGLVSRAAARVVGETGFVFPLDPSGGMLRQLVKSKPMPAVQARGEGLPFRDASFDFVSLGYGLRHVAGLDLLFAEIRRVLKPGGRVLIMEFARPKSKLGGWVGRVYLQKLIPALTRIGTRSGSAETVMRYCFDTVEQAVEPQLVLDAMKGAGLAGPTRKGMLGIFAEYAATRPAAGA